MEYLYTIKVLLPFELIYDIDVGLVKFIRNNYQDSDIFKDYLFDMDDDEIVGNLTTRMYENPLYGLSKDEIDHSEIDELYDDFIKTKYKEIIELSPETYLASVFEVCSKTKGMNYSIYYKSELEGEKLKENGFSNENLIDCTESPMNLRKMKEFDIIYAKYPKDIPKKIEGKNLYFADYPYNYLYFEMKDGKITPAVRPEFIELSKNNVIKFTGIYIDSGFVDSMNKNNEEEDEENE